jgi:hypothetical protein
MNRAERRSLGVKKDLIETQWRSLAKATGISEKDNPVQYQEMRRGFFSGAFALLQSIISVLEPGDEPTDKDLAQMDAIDQEITQFFLTIGSPFEGQSMGGEA